MPTLTSVASTYDASLASVINVEFKELLIQELEKVDDRFFEVHDECEDNIDGLDSAVSLLALNTLCLPFV